MKGGSAELGGVINSFPKDLHIIHQILKSQTSFYKQLMHMFCLDLDACNHDNPHNYCPLK